MIAYHIINSFLNKSYFSFKSRESRPHFLTSTLKLTVFSKRSNYFWEKNEKLCQLSRNQICTSQVSPSLTQSVIFSSSPAHITSTQTEDDHLVFPSSHPPCTCVLWPVLQFTSVNTQNTHQVHIQLHSLFNSLNVTEWLFSICNYQWHWNMCFFYKHKN